MSTSIYGENSPIEKSYLKEITKKYNYVYMITELSTNKKYIGVRSCDIPIEDDLGKIYISSSTDESFIQRQKENKTDYSYTVLSNYETREEANAEEIRLHNLYDVDINEEYYNKTKSNSKLCDTLGKCTVKDKDGNSFLVSVNDERLKTGELVGITKGFVVVKDRDGNTFQVESTDPRYLSGELVSVSVGKVSAKDKDGNNITVQSDDPRLKTGELVGITKGKTVAKDKDGNVHTVDKDDARLKTGELVGITKGIVVVRDKDNNIFPVLKTDPRYVSGELVFYQKDMVKCFDKDGNKLLASPKDPRFKTGELIKKAQPKSARYYYEQSKLKKLNK